MHHHDNVPFPAFVEAIRLSASTECSVCIYDGELSLTLVKKAAI